MLLNNRLKLIKLQNFELTLYIIFSYTLSLFKILFQIDFVFFYQNGINLHFITVLLT